MIETLQNIVEETLDVNGVKLTNDTRIIEDLEADSLDMVELIMAVEEAFDITIEDSEATSLLTIGQLIEFIGQKNNEQ